MDIEALNTALEKIRGGETTPPLQPADVEALTAYLNRVSAKGERTEAETLLCKHIRSVLQEHAVAARRAASEAESPGYQRSNFILRAAIDRFLGHEFEDVTEADLGLLRGTADELARMARTHEPSPNEVRLSRLIAECLAGYESWRAGTA